MGLLEGKVRIAILLAADLSGRKARFRVGHAGTHDREAERVLDGLDQTGMFPKCGRYYSLEGLFKCGEKETLLR